MSTKTTTIDLAHTTRPGVFPARVTKISKATVFVELESGSAERFNRSTGKRVGGNYREGDFIISPADLQRLTDTEGAEAPSEEAAPAAAPVEPVAEEAAAPTADEEAEHRDMMGAMAPEGEEEEPGESAPSSTPRPKGELRIDTREIVDTAARVGRAATRCRKQAEFFEAVATPTALTVAGHLRAAQKAYEAAAALAPSVKLASKEGASASAPKGLQPGAAVKLNEAGLKVFAGVLDGAAVLTVASNRGRVIECRTPASPAPMFIERRYLVAAE